MKKNFIKIVKICWHSLKGSAEKLKTAYSSVMWCEWAVTKLLSICMLIINQIMSLFTHVFRYKQFTILFSYTPLNEFSVPILERGIYIGYPWLNTNFWRIIKFCHLSPWQVQKCLQSLKVLECTYFCYMLQKFYDGFFKKVYVQLLKIVATCLSQSSTFMS